jgi:hypothetical protein
MLTGMGVFSFPFSVLTLELLAVVSTGLEKNIFLLKSTIDSSFLTFTFAGGLTSFCSLLFVKKFSFPVPLFFSFALSEVGMGEAACFTFTSVFTGSVFAGSGAAVGFDFEGPATGNCGATGSLPFLGGPVFEWSLAKKDLGVKAPTLMPLRTTRPTVAAHFAPFDLSMLLTDSEQSQINAES